MIENWLQLKERSKSPYIFKLIEVNEISKPSTEIEDYLSREVLANYRDLEYFKFAYQDLSIKELEKYIKSYVLPSDKNTITKNVFQGDFGELLIGLIATYFLNLSIPFKKLKWKLNKDRSLFSTDLIAHNEGNEIKEMYYYEIKTRLGIRKEQDQDKSSKYITVIAYNSLHKEQHIPDDSVADFISRYYYEKEEFSKAKQYGDIARGTSTCSRNYELCFIIEKSKYIEEILIELSNIPPSLNPLRVTVVLISDLGRLLVRVKSNTINVANRIVFA